MQDKVLAQNTQHAPSQPKEDGLDRELRKTRDFEGMCVVQ